MLEEPAVIHAVDLNYRQNALLALKLAAITELEWQDFFAMFGKGRDPGSVTGIATAYDPIF